MSWLPREAGQGRTQALEVKTAVPSAHLKKHRASTPRIRTQPGLCLTHRVVEVKTLCRTRADVGFDWARTIPPHPEQTTPSHHFTSSQAASAWRHRGPFHPSFIRSAWSFTLTRAVVPRSPSQRTAKQPERSCSQRCKGRKPLLYPRREVLKETLTAPGRGIVDKATPAIAPLA